MEWNIKSFHRREDGGTTALELESADKQFDVNARWDGCLEMHVFHVTEEGREFKDTIHTCDINGLINVLQSLTNQCKEFFGAGSYWETNDEKLKQDRLEL
jgi:hypothetical protein